jgi:hypothetical protein
LQEVATKNPPAKAKQVAFFETPAAAIATPPAAKAAKKAAVSALQQVCQEQALH